MLTDWRTLTAANPGLTLDPMNAQYDIGLRPGTDPNAYVRALAPKLGSNLRRLDQPERWRRRDRDRTRGYAHAAPVDRSRTGVLNTVVLHTRERVHDLGVFKAVGMTPRQTVAMVLCSVAGTGLLAGVLAVPAGIVVHRYVIPAMAGAAGLGVPPSLQNVYGVGELAVLALAGLVIALAGALLPAGWAAQSRTASALRTE